MRRKRRLARSPLLGLNQYLTAKILNLKEPSPRFCRISSLMGTRRGCLIFMPSLGLKVHQTCTTKMLVLDGMKVLKDIL